MKGTTLFYYYYYYYSIPPSKGVEMEGETTISLFSLLPQKGWRIQYF